MQLLLVVISILLTGLPTYAGTDIRKGGSVVARVDDHGTIRVRGSGVGRFDSGGAIRVGGRVVGNIDNDGTIRRGGSVAGKIDAGGYVRIRGRVVGRVEDSGDVRRKGSVIGSARGLNRSQTAALFFFDFIKF